MGIIQRQAIKQSIVTYVGTVIGMINLLYIYPNFLTRPEQGAIMWVLGTANLFAPFVNMGMTTTTVHFFTRFQNKSGDNNGFLGAILSWVSISYFILLLIFLIFKNPVLKFYEASEFGTQFFLFTIPIAYALAIILVLTSYTSNYKRIVIPSIITELSQKILIPTFVLLFAFKWITFYQIFYLINFMFFGIIIGLLYYLYTLGGLNFKINRFFFTKELNKEILSYLSYAILGGISFTLVYNIDMFMLGNLLPEMALTGVAVYGFAAHISNVIDVPRKSILKIARPIIAESIQNNDLENVQSIYSKAAINQFLFGLFILLGVLLCFDDLIKIMPNGNDFAEGKMVIFLLGIGVLVDAVTSTNTDIIGYSKYYRFNFYATLILGLLAVIANIILIPKLLILGATIATLFAKSTSNIMKTVYVYYKFKIHPFSMGIIWTIIIGLLSFLIAEYIPDFGKPILNILLKGTVFSGIFISAIVFSNISQEINNFSNKLLKFK